ncbi:MAG: hypothetical protein ACREJD_08855 [Phycisphaerales bacterium]
MRDPSHLDRSDELTTEARARRDAMLPGLLAEVRRVRRRRTVTRVASAAAALALVSGILALALLRPSLPTSSTSWIAKSPARDSALPPESQPTHVEIIGNPADILEHFAIRSPSLVQVQYITTDEALTLLQSTGDRYGIIEIAGRVEFQLIAKK